MNRQQAFKINQGNHQKGTQLSAKSALSTHAPLHPFLQLQQRHGNHALGRFIQAKLAINQPEDIYEQEADRVAEQVMRMPEPFPAMSSNEHSPPALQRKCAACGSGQGLCPQCAEEEKMVQRKSVPALTLIHETSHIYYSTEDTGGGPGNASCLENFMADANGVAVHPDFVDACRPPR